MFFFFSKKSPNVVYPQNFIDSNFHRNAIMESENLINQIDMSKLEHDSCKKIYADNIRFEFKNPDDIIVTFLYMTVNPKIRTCTVFVNFI